MATQTVPVTIEQFWDFVQRPENQDRGFELVSGVIVEMVASGKKNTALGMWNGYFLAGYVIPHDLGVVAGADSGFQIGPHTIRQPDVAFISKARAGGWAGAFFPVAPDLAIEVISPSESARDVVDKARDYLSGGTKAVWTVYPDGKVIDVITLSPDNRCSSIRCA